MEYYESEKSIIIWKEMKIALKIKKKIIRNYNFIIEKGKLIVKECLS